MNNIFTYGILGLLLFQTAHSQNPTLTPVTDTIHYYYNKEFFKRGTQPGNFAYFKLAASTSSNVTHIGSRFENNDTSLRISGLEALMCRNNISSQIKVNVRLYLCKVNNGNINFPGDCLDSVTVEVSGLPNLRPLGADFKDGKTYLMNGDYAVMARNISSFSGDTVRIARTTSKTFTAFPNVGWQEKYSDGYGLVRQKGNLRSTANFTATGFGNMTDYEFCVAPRVTYNMYIGQEMPEDVVNKVPICTFQQLKFKAQTSYQVTHRMYNLNEFYKKWNLYQPLGGVNGGWSSDSTVMWEFEPEWGDKMSKMYLPYGGGNKEITFYTDHAEPFPFTANSFKVKYRPMGRCTNNIGNVEFAESFTLIVMYCEGDTVGISNPSLNALSVFPNPSDHLNISGLNASTYEVSIFNVQGIRVKALTLKDTQSAIETHDLKAGMYWIQVKDPQTAKFKTLKWIKS